MNDKFKIGDKVVCINKSCSICLESNKIYTIKNITNKTVTLENIYNSYFKDRFILLSEYRKQKIETLL